jgi:hypothetical protein
MRNILIGVILGVALSYVGSAALAQVYARVNTNGVLKGYTVQKGKRTICRDPEAWLDFRGEGSFIVCP